MNIVSILIFMVISSLTIGCTDLGGFDSDYPEVIDQRGYEWYGGCFPGEYGMDEHPFVLTEKDPKSSFSIDVDTASYTRARDQLNSGQIPNALDIRTEEFVNYFQYDFHEPCNNESISATYEVGPSPWNAGAKIIRVVLKGKDLKLQKVAPMNLVFLIDVSGSMNSNGRLNLVKHSLKTLVKSLRKEDKISVITYASEINVPINALTGEKKDIILKEINQLVAEGGTAGHPGLQKAYEVAHKNFVVDGVNRVILSTDGDFNIGMSSTSELKDFIVKKAKGGVFLSVYGYGMNGYRDELLETLSNSGNGNYAYIDNPKEANKVFRSQLLQNLVVVAKDVKAQMTFTQDVYSYRLIGYENRRLLGKEFENKDIDAGDLGANQTVTALYEVEINMIIGIDDPEKKLSKEEKKRLWDFYNRHNEVLAELKVNYKDLPTEKTKQLSLKIKNSSHSIKETSDDFKLSTSAAGFALLLGRSKYIGRQYNYDQIPKTLQLIKRPDSQVDELLQLIKLNQNLVELD